MKKPVHSIARLALVVSLGLGTMAGAMGGCMCTQPYIATSTVTVRDSGGNPVNGANVTITQTDGRVQTFTARSSGGDSGVDDGVYQAFGGVRAGGTLHVDAPGFTTVERSLEAGEAREDMCGYTGAMITVTLTPAP